VSVRKDGARKGRCGEHTKADLDDLINMFDDKMRQEKRTGEEGWEAIAKHCWHCGCIV
jgi:hypothetical protein